MSYPSPATRKVLGIGEVLWDCLPDGRQLGGAPANFAWHCRRLGLSSDIVSAVGDDEHGKQALRQLRAGDIPCRMVSLDPVHPTGRVDVLLDSAGKPEYRFLPNTAWDHPCWTDEAAQAIAEADCLCFGTLAQRSAEGRRFLQHCLQSASPQALKIFDINLRQRFYSPEILREGLCAANVVKLNDEELPTLAAAAGIPFGGDEKSILRTICQRYDLQGIALTCGAKGATLIIGEEVGSAPAARVTIADTIGAGDAFTAVLAYGLLATLPPVVILNAAVLYAGQVCTYPGGMPAVDSEIMQNLFCITCPTHLPEATERT